MAGFISFTVYPDISDIAREIVGASVDIQVEIFIAIARRLTDKQRAAILNEINSSADEEESIALAALGEALNERN